MSPQMIARLVLPAGEGDHIQGPRNAAVTLLEYGDFECPQCAAAHPVLDALRERLRNRFRFAYRHFPLSQVHPHAFQAGEAAEAAGAQGRFWEMHDALFVRQGALSEPDLLRRADALKLDVTALAGDLAEHRFAQKVREDFLSGVRSGVSGTPTFFIGEHLFEGAADFRSLAVAIQEAA